MTGKKLPKIKLSKRRTKRPVNSGAEKWLGKPIPVLDHGFVYLVDYMGGDAAIEQAARVSYGSGTRTVSQTEGLIRYLKRNWHTTPFEMVEFKFHAKMPLFVARQWVRHRTANINEYSGRYSILEKEFYIPDASVIAVQSKSNRQGRGVTVDKKVAKKIQEILIEDAKLMYEHYEEMLNDDGSGKPVDSKKPMISRELARMNLNLNYYTQWYWKIDLHNLFHFLNLRMDAHAQWEIRQYANAMAKIVKDSVPLAWKAFEDYHKESGNFSQKEQLIITALLSKRKKAVNEKEVVKLADKVGLTNKREREELLKKFQDLGILPNSA